MSQQPPEPGAEGQQPSAPSQPTWGQPAPQPPVTPPGWTPPTAWSPEQPPQWGPPAGPPPPGWGQPAGPPPPGWGQPGWGQPAGAQPPGWGPAWQAAQAPKPGIVPLRPIGVGELLDGALQLIRSNPRTVLGLAAVISAVSAVIQTIGLASAFAVIDLDATSTPVDPDPTAELLELGTLTAAQLLPAIVAAFLQSLASGLFIVLVGAAVLGRRLDAGQTWTLLRPRLWALLGLTLLLGVGFTAFAGIVVGVIVLLALALGGWAAIPGLLLALAAIVASVYVYVRLAVAPPALVMEGRSPFEALGRSWSLIRGSWWRVAGILLLASVITQVLAGIVTVPITVISSVGAALLGADAADATTPMVIATGIATLVSGIIIMPFSAAVTGLLYTDLRIRREALDIELVSAGVDPSADPLAPYKRPVG